MKTLHTLSRWVYPFFLGIVIFNFLRLVTDFLRYETFWIGSWHQHLISMMSFIAMCYAYDATWRRELKKRLEQQSPKATWTMEFIRVLVSILFPLNIVAFTGEQIGLYYMGNGLADYIVLNVVTVPLLLLYYAIIRNEIVNREYESQSFLLEQLKSQQLETELNYLKAQYHPHFLFNALNTIYFQVDEDNVSAKKSIELLSELLRYQLYEVDKEVMIADEIKFIQSYIRFQSLRMSERLQLDIQIDRPLDRQRIYPLLFQPLLENAFKYVGGDYMIKIGIKVNTGSIKFDIINSLADTQKHGKGKGIGLENLRRRLELLFPGNYSLETKKEKHTFIAKLIIPTSHED